MRLALEWLWALPLLAVNLVYLWRMLRFRQAWTSPPSPLSKREGELAASSLSDTSFSELKTSSPSLFERGLGGEVPSFSILIAARNEEANLPQLLEDLARQQPVPGGVEVVIIDDYSTDATAALVTEAARRFPVPLRLLRLQDLPGAPTGKKAAVEAGVQAARAPWVLLTDADCRVPAGWVRAYAVAVSRQPQVRFLSGPVLLTGRGVLAILQGLELAGLVGVGAASIRLGQPTMCNGANLAYRRADFFAVRGFQGNEQVASGDDEFLLHKLHAAFPGSIGFVQEPEAIVRTAAQPTLRQLLGQRVRWASKWRHYQAAAPRRLAVLVLLSNLTFPVGAGLWLAGVAPGGVVAAAWGIKLAADTLFLGPVLRFLGRWQWLWWVPVLQAAYGPYALGVGVWGLRGGYEWKGRRVGESGQKKE